MVVTEVFTGWFTSHLNDALTGQLFFLAVLNHLWGGLKASNGLVDIGEDMSEEGTFFGRLWAKQHGKQFGISAIAAGASGILLVACMYQLLFLQDHAEWNDYTGGAIVGAVLSLLIFLIAFPEYLRFKGYVAVLEELKEIPRPNFADKRPTVMKLQRRWVQDILSSGKHSLIAVA